MTTATADATADTDAKTPDRLVRIPGRFFDQMDEYISDRADASDAEENREYVDWSAIDDQAHNIAYEIDSLNRDGVEVPDDIDALAKAIVNDERPHTVMGLHLDYSADTPEHLQIEVAGESDGEHPLYAYPNAAGLHRLEALFGALAKQIEKRSQDIAKESGE